MNCDSAWRKGSHRRPRAKMVLTFARLRGAAMLLVLAWALMAAEPLEVDGGGPAPDLLTDRMQRIFDTFDDQAAIGATPSAVTITWDDFAYTLSAADYLAYREGERTFLQTVAQVRIARVPFWSPRVLWRRFGWAIAVSILFVLLFVLLLLVRRRRRNRRAAAASPASPSPLPAAGPVSPQASPLLCLYPLVGSPQPLQAELTTIGSQEGNHIRLSTRGVAPHHARIWRTREGTWFVEDLAAPFATLVNGQPVSRQWLQPGDTLRLGEWQARVEWSYPGLPQFAPTHFSQPHR